MMTALQSDKVLQMITRHPENRLINIKTGKIHCLNWHGNLPQVHFLHANGFCAGTYAPFLKLLCPENEILASDLRGHGDSSGISGNLHKWEVFADDLADFLQRTTTQPIIGIGHSLGAVVTFMAAAKHKNLFSKIILIDPVIFSPVSLFGISLARFFRLGVRVPLAEGARRRKSRFESMDEARERFSSGRGMFRHWQKEFIDAYLNCALARTETGEALLKCDPELEAAIYESLPTKSYRVAKKIHCPVHLIRGKYSSTFLEKSALILKNHLKNAKLHTIENAGHFIPMENPEECARVINSIL